MDLCVKECKLVESPKMAANFLLHRKRLLLWCAAGGRCVCVCVGGVLDEDVRNPKLKTTSRFSSP
jgi:hypothetical protein